MTHATILDEAKIAVYGDRQNDYGSVTDNFNKVAQLWSVVLNVPVTAEQVGLCMVQLKIARQMFKPKRDNLVDGAGYFATLEKMEMEKGGEGKSFEEIIREAESGKTGYITYWIDKQGKRRKTCTMASDAEEAKAATAHMYKDFKEWIKSEKGELGFTYDKD